MHAAHLRGDVAVTERRRQRWSVVIRGVVVRRDGGHAGYILLNLVVVIGVVPLLTAAGGEVLTSNATVNGFAAAAVG